MNDYKMGDQFWPKSESEYNSILNYFSSLNNQNYQDAHNDKIRDINSRYIGTTPAGKLCIIYINPTDSVAYALRDVGASYHQERTSYYYYDLRPISRTRTETKVTGLKGTYDEYHDEINIKPVEEHIYHRDDGLEIRTIRRETLNYDVYVLYYNPSLTSEQNLKNQINSLSRDSLSFHEELQSRRTLGSKYKNMTAFTRWSAVLLVLTFVLNISMFISLISVPFITREYFIYILGGALGLTFGVDIINQLVIRKIRYYFLEHEVGDYYQLEWQFAGFSLAYIALIVGTLVNITWLSFILMVILIGALIEAAIFIYFNIYLSVSECFVSNLWDAGEMRHLSHQKMNGAMMSIYSTQVNNVRALL